MKKTFLIIFLGLISLHTLKGQIPDPPVFKRVSVDPATGFTSFYWEPSPSAEVDGHIIYILQDIFGWQPIDTIWGRNETFWEWTSLNARFRFEAYVMSALNVDTIAVDTLIDRESELTDYHRTMFFPKMEFNPCSGTMEMGWNGYEGWKDSLSHYLLLRQENGGTMDTIVLNKTDTSYTDSDIQAYSTYCYYAQAVHLDGRISTSFTFCDSANAKRPPDYVYAYGSKFIDGSIVELSFSIDVNSELENYYLIRSAPGDVAYDTIRRITLSSGGPIVLKDTLPEPGSYSYYLLSMNQCGKEAVRSNQSNLIWLEVSNKNFLNYLEWNNYRSWTGGIETYNIFRIIGDEPAVMIHSQAPPDSTYTDNTEDIIYSSDGSFCYYIGAVEGEGNPLGLKGTSQSNLVCIQSEPRIFMPNAFTPNNDGLNEEFKPVLSFTPVEYVFIIRNRWSNTIFMSNNHEEAWDGSHAGKKVPEGIYVYYIKTQAPNGSVIEKSGQVMVLYPNK